MDFSPAIYGLLLASSGKSWLFSACIGQVVPLHIMQVTQLGYSQILVASFGASFAQTAVVMAMYFKLKDKN